MTVRTQDDLLTKLDDEFAWRQKELTSIWGDVQTAPDKAREARLRAGVALLYAHWEGFVKAAGDLFVQFVAIRKLRHDQLNSGLLSLALRQRLREFAQSSAVERHIEFLNFLENDMGSRARLPLINVIKTGANLNSERFREIVLTLGLDYSAYELKENLIDRQLLDWRNSIAHGKALCPSKDDFDTLYGEVKGLLRLFKDQMENAVVLQTYKRQK
jgi:hypothetical protein